MSRDFSSCLKGWDIRSCSLASLCVDIQLSSSDDYGRRRTTTVAGSFGPGRRSQPRQYALPKLTELGADISNGVVVFTYDKVVPGGNRQKDKARITYRST
jgi:hypothetical protein